MACIFQKQYNTTQYTTIPGECVNFQLTVSLSRLSTLQILASPGTHQPHKLSFTIFKTPAGSSKAFAQTTFDGRYLTLWVYMGILYTMLYPNIIKHTKYIIK